MAEATLTIFEDGNPPVSHRHGNIVVNLGGVNVVLTRHAALRIGHDLFNTAGKPEEAATAQIVNFDSQRSQLV